MLNIDSAFNNKIHDKIQIPGGPLVKQCYVPTLQSQIGEQDKDTRQQGKFTNRDSKHLENDLNLSIIFFKIFSEGSAISKIQSYMLETTLA